MDWSRDDSHLEERNQAFDSLIFIKLRCTNLRTVPITHEPKQWDTETVAKEKTELLDSTSQWGREDGTVKRSLQFRNQAGRCVEKSRCRRNV
jgi:hypothetical protein